MLLSHTSKISLLLETLEDRLTPSWSTVPPLTITPPTNYVAVTQDNLGDATGSTTIATSEIDWYRFTALASGTATFQAQTPASNLDPVIGLYSSSGKRLAYNDDISQSNLDSRFTANLSVGATYYFGVTNYLTSSGGAYNWSLDGAAPNSNPGDDNYEDNDTRATAFDLGSITDQRSLPALVMADGHDWFRFTLSTAGTASSSVAINFQNVLGDLDLELYNSAGTRIGTADGAGDTETISLSGRSAGTYYVHVLGYQGAANPLYNLIITPNGGPTAGGFSIQLRMSGLTSGQQAVFQQAAARWEQIITGDLPNATYNGVAVDDLLIDASARTIDGRGGILGQAGPDRFRTGTAIPYHGAMQFDSADLSSLESGGGLIYTVMHEIGHILGIGTIWSTRGLLSGASTSNPRFTGPRATAEYNSIFGASATGVPVENSGGSGTRNSHWRESIFGNELMTGYLNTGFNPLSRITIASLADLGYQVDMNQADGYSPGGNGFLRSGGNGSGSGSSLRLADMVLPSILTDQLTPSTSTSHATVPVKPAVPIQFDNEQPRQKEVTDQWFAQTKVSKPALQAAKASNQWKLNLGLKA